MPLHPDKLVGITNAVKAGKTSEDRAVSAAANRGTGVAKSPQGTEQSAGVIEHMAYELRDQHWARHLDRLKRNVDKVKPKQGSRSTGPKQPAQAQQPIILLQPKSPGVRSLGG